MSDTRQLPPALHPPNIHLRIPPPPPRIEPQPHPPPPQLLRHKVKRKRINIHTLRTLQILTRIEDLAIEDGIQDPRTLARVEGAACPGDGVLERADEGHVLLHPE